MNPLLIVAEGVAAGALVAMLVIWNYNRIQRRRGGGVLAEAEAELAQVKAKGVYEGPELTSVRDRVADLETENRMLRERIDAARERVRTLNARLAFLERGGS